MLQNRAAEPMRMAHPTQSIVTVRLATCLVMGFALGGCSSGTFGGGGAPSWFPSLPGFSNVSSSGNAGSALAAASTANALSMEDNCPTVDVRTGTGTLAVAAKAQAATASDLRYQVT